MTNTAAPHPLPKPPMRLFNVLPHRYKTWLEFYDNIPMELREEDSLRTVVEASRKEFVAAYPAQAETAAMLAIYHIEYQTSREWMLARIAEELLPSRMLKADINLLEGSLHRASKYDSGGDFYKAAELLTPLWAVGRDK